MIKFDLSEVDPDHREFLQKEAGKRNVTVDELLDAERLGKATFNCVYREYQDEEALEDLGRLTITKPEVTEELPPFVCHNKQNRKHLPRASRQIEQSTGGCLVLRAHSHAKPGYLPSCCFTSSFSTPTLLAVSFNTSGVIFNSLACLASSASLSVSILSRSLYSELSDIRLVRLSPALMI
jgi:hypothetical protein